MTVTTIKRKQRTDCWVDCRQNAYVMFSVISCHEQLKINKMEGYFILHRLSCIGLQTKWSKRATQGGHVRESCPIHPTRVDSSLVFAIRLTGNPFLNPLNLWSNQYQSFPLVSSRHTGSRVENIAPLKYSGWVKMLPIRLDSIESTRIVSPAVDSTCRKSICTDLDFR